MDVLEARSVARSLHATHREFDGTPLLWHLERVARRTASDARAVAWLHETLEYGAATEQELLVRGLTDDQLRALRLLTHRMWDGNDRAYLARVQLIARAAGPGGRLARLVMRADLEDRRRHPSVRPDGWTPPYEHAIELLRRRGGSGHLPLGEGLEGHAPVDPSPVPR
jgi:hypothetical protein